MPSRSPARATLAAIRVDDAAKVAALTKRSESTLRLLIPKMVVLGAKRTLERVLQQRERVGPSDYRRTTLLMLAASHGRRELLESLVQVNEVNARRTDGQTALMMAALRNDADMVRRLLEHGADRSVADRHGLTALDLAADPGVRALLAAEAVEWAGTSSVYDSVAARCADAERAGAMIAVD